MAKDKTIRKLPNISQKPILYVDATPDRDYPLRILRAYREDCNVKWETRGKPNPILDLMNADCDKRAKILNAAIKILEQHKGVVEDKK
jgi:hypothetical protein